MFTFELVNLAQGESYGPTRNEERGVAIVVCINGKVIVRSSVIENTRYLEKKQFYTVGAEEEITIDGEDPSSTVQLYVNPET